MGFPTQLRRDSTHCQPAAALPLRRNRVPEGTRKPRSGPARRLPEAEEHGGLAALGFLRIPHRCPPGGDVSSRTAAGPPTEPTAYMASRRATSASEDGSAVGGRTHPPPSRPPRQEDARPPHRRGGPGGGNCLSAARAGKGSGSSSGGRAECEVNVGTRRETSRYVRQFQKVGFFFLLVFEENRLV